MSKKKSTSTCRCVYNAEEHCASVNGIEIHDVKDFSMFTDCDGRPYVEIAFYPDSVRVDKEGGKKK